MFQYCFPIRELRTAKVNPFPSEMIRAVRRAVVNEVGPFQETLVVAEDQPLLEIGIQVHLDPVQFVGPARRVVPGCGGQKIDVVLLSQSVEGFQCARHRVHQREHPGSVLGMRRIALQHLRTQAVDAGIEINKDAVHVHVKGLL